MLWAPASCYFENERRNAYELETPAFRDFLPQEYELYQLIVQLDPDRDEYLALEQKIDAHNARIEVIDNHFGRMRNGQRLTTADKLMSEEVLLLRSQRDGGFKQLKAEVVKSRASDIESWTFVATDQQMLKTHQSALAKWEKLKEMRASYRNKYGHTEDQEPFFFYLIRILIFGAAWCSFMFLWSYDFYRPRRQQCEAR